MPHAVVDDMMAKDKELWKQRPLPAVLKSYAAEDVSQLLSLAEVLLRRLLSIGQSTVLALSTASSHLKLPIKPGFEVRLNLYKSLMWH